MYSKPIIDNGTDCELERWTSESLGLNGAFTFPLITNHGKGTKEPSESVFKIILKKPLLGLENETHWSQTSLSPEELPLWV